jgi:hypothetical protein
MLSGTVSGQWVRSNHAPYSSHRTPFGAGILRRHRAFLQEPQIEIVHARRGSQAEAIYRENRGRNVGFVRATG